MCKNFVHVHSATLYAERGRGTTIAMPATQAAALVRAGAINVAPGGMLVLDEGIDEPDQDNTRALRALNAELLAMALQVPGAFISRS